MKNQNEPEALIQKSILSLLERHPSVSFAHRYNSGAHMVSEGSKRRFIRYGVIGHPDIGGVLKGGRAFFIEVKTKGGKLTAEQSGFLQKANDAGALAFVARSIDDVLKQLNLLE